MNAPRLSWGAGTLLFLLALVLRGASVVQYESMHPLAQRPAIDEASYDTWAREIAQGDWLGDEIFFQEPLYPYGLGAIYALAGDEPEVQRRAARWVQVALGAAVACVSAAIATRCFGVLAGWIAGLLVALHRPSLWFPALLLKENAFVLVLSTLALGLVSTARIERVEAEQRRAWILWLGLGALGAVGALLRGNMLVMLPALALWPLARAHWHGRSLRRSLAACAAFGVGALLALAPIAIRNHHVGGRWVLTTSGAGTNFYGGNNLDNPYGLAKEFDWVRGIPEHEAGDWRREASRRAGRELDPAETSAFWLDATLDSMAERPLAHLNIFWNKLRLTLGSYEVPDNHFLEWDASYVPILQLAWPGFAVVGALGVAGLLMWLVARRVALPVPDSAAAGEVALLALLYLGTIVLTVTSERIRWPLVALLAPFAGWFVASAFDRSASVGSRLARMAALALAAPLVLLPVLPVAELSEDLDERDHNFAVALIEADALDEAAKVVDGLLERRPNSPRVKLLAADFAYRLARRSLDALPTQRRVPAEAGERIERALRLLEGISKQGNAQERYRANLLAGAIRQYLGHWELAEQAFRAARSFDAEDRDVRRRLAVVIAERAMQSSDLSQRALGLGEAIALVEALLVERDEAELVQLREKLLAAMPSTAR